MPISVDLEAIGRRVEELRGKLSQTDFASRLGVDRKTVGTWERGERLPDTRALLGLWSEFDAEPAWVLCGTGASPSISSDERELLALFRAAPLAVKAAAIGALQGGSAPGPKVQIGGKVVGQVVEGGLVNSGPINIGGKKRKT